MNNKVTIFWFRRDLRLHDNAGLYAALKEEKNVLPIFIFDKNILDKLPKRDARVSFLHTEISNLKETLNTQNSDLVVQYGNPKEVWEDLIKRYDIETVYTNHDYEPYGRTRDSWVKKRLQTENIEFKTYKDQVIFEKSEVVKADGDPYTVFTPYFRKWKERLTPSDLSPFSTESYFENFAEIKSPTSMPSLQDMNFEVSSIKIPQRKTDKSIIKTYDQTRDIPALSDGTSRLGLHLRFGTISIRDLAAQGNALNEIFLSELGWRDFYQQILWHFPHVAERSFRAKYDVIQWRNNKDEFKKWCEGQTGYPIVDAGMRQLNQTGYMHNRVRMVVASFLCKHLLIDWRWGEKYFAEKLLDFDLAANNGGWQWSAGTGCDAAPYFRVFNPESQQKKFDPKFEYIKTWVPEYGTDNYIEPMVEHKMARQRALDTYKSALNPE